MVQRIIPTLNYLHLRTEQATLFQKVQSEIDETHGYEKHSRAPAHVHARARTHTHTHKQANTQAHMLLSMHACVCTHT